jgi:hypothetical protein
VCSAIVNLLPIRGAIVHTAPVDQRKLLVLVAGCKLDLRLAKIKFQQPVNPKYVTWMSVVPCSRLTFALPVNFRFPGLALPLPYGFLPSHSTY